MINLAFLASYPVALVLVGICLANVVALLRRRLHPLRILTLTLVNATAIGVIGILAVLPGSLWWAGWILPALTVAAAVFACWRVLATEPRPDVTGRRRTLLQRPPTVMMAAVAVLFLAVAVVAVASG